MLFLWCFLWCFCSVDTVMFPEEMFSVCSAPARQALQIQLETQEKNKLTPGQCWIFVKRGGKIKIFGYKTGLKDQIISIFVNWKPFLTENFEFRGKIKGSWKNICWAGRPHCFIVIQKMSSGFYFVLIYFYFMPWIFNVQWLMIKCSLESAKI